MPKISIIIPTRNRNSYLKKCLTSLINQTFKNFEVLVCDDGGTSKNTKLVAEKFNKYFPVKYFWNKDKGAMSPASARNIGWKKAQGKYLLFLDCDIILPQKSIKRLHSWFTKYSYRKTSFHVTPSARIHIKKNVPLNIIKNNLRGIDKYIVRKGNLSISTVGLFSKKIVDKIGGFDDILFVGYAHEDIEMGARLFAFLNNKRKKLLLKVYHLDHYSNFTSRDKKPRNKLKLTRFLIKKKFEMLGFKYNIKYHPKKDLNKFTNKYYNNLLVNKVKINKISKLLYLQAKNGKIKS